jgi:hypothetical protein
LNPIITFSEIESEIDVAESRSDDFDESPKTPIRGIKLRRKKLIQNVEENYPIKKMQRKKIPIIIPTLTSTTTTTPTPQVFIPEDGALNRTDEDSRCEFVL